MKTRTQIQSTVDTLQVHNANTSALTMLSGPDRLKLIDPLTLQDKQIPARRWAVADWIPHGAVTGVSGDGGIGKTLLVQQLLTSTAIGQSWLGLATTPAKAIGFFAEDVADEIWRRQQRINDHHEIEFGDLQNLKWASLVGVDCALAEFDHDRAEATDLYLQILEAAKEFGAQLIVLDSLHDFFIGNENNRVHARQFINLLGGLALAIDGSVVLTAHPSLSGLSSGSGTSGSTAWNNAFRSRLYLEKVSSGGTADEFERVLKRKKSNYSGLGDDLTLNWTDGVFIAQRPPEGILAGMHNRNADRVFMALLSAVTGEGRHVSDHSHSGNFAPRRFAIRPDRQGFTKVDFATSMERLFADGKIKVESYGPPSKHQEHIVPVLEPSDENPF